MYEKLKEEMYKNLGGINVKASDYMTGDNQVLNLRNYTFDRPGAWVSRPGYTGIATLNAGGSYAPDSIFEAIFQGSSTRPVIGPSMQAFSQSSATLFIYASGTTLYNNTSLSAIASGLGPGSSGVGPVDFQIFNNNLYFANGYTFQKYTGYYSLLYSVPPGGFNISPYFIFSGGNLGATFASIFTGGGTLATGTFYAQFAPARFNPQTNNYEYGTPNGQTFVFSNPTSANGVITFFVGNTLPFSTSIYNQYGVSWAALYINGPGTGGEYFLGTTQPFAIGPFIDSPNPLPDGSGDFVLGSVNGSTQWYLNYNIAKGDFPQTAQEPQTNIYFTLAPRFLETYNNMMFMAGFSLTPSIVWHTELGNPDIIEPEYFFEVRTTGNGDILTAMKVFQNSLVLFKQSSTHILTGDSPETLSLQDVNLDYGCLNNEAAVTFENKLWFMDIKGIAEYNGANTFIVSAPVESYLDECDKFTARGYHLKKYFQVWYLVRVSGTSNWRIFAYDYLIDAWTIYDIFLVTGGSNLFTNSDSTKDLVFYGQNASLQSKFMKFNSSAVTDDGFGITHIIKTKNHKRLGDSTTELWRRFFLNNSIGSSHLGVTLNFYPDYGSSIYYTANMGTTMFQSRIETGIPAKSMSVEIVVNATQKITVNGYTIESRYLRSV